MLNATIFDCCESPCNGNKNQQDDSGLQYYVDATTCGLCHAAEYDLAQNQI